MSRIKRNMPGERREKIQFQPLDFSIELPAPSTLLSAQREMEQNSDEEPDQVLAETLLLHDAHHPPRDQAQPHFFTTAQLGHPGKHSRRGGIPFFFPPSPSPF
jgi:hypothetical protein